MDREPYDRHWIRLRGPWEVVWIGNDGQSEPPVRVKLPADWRSLFAERLGTARFLRRFQRPTNLDADERVCITLSDVNAAVRLAINDHEVPTLSRPLGDPDSWPAADCCSFDITDHLQAMNRLTLTVTVTERPTGDVGLHQPVLLEIITFDDDRDASE